MVYATLQREKIMGHILHARARTTPAVRREIQNSQESLTTLAARCAVNPKTIEK